MGIVAAVINMEQQISILNKKKLRNCGVFDGPTWNPRLTERQFGQGTKHLLAIKKPRKNRGFSSGPTWNRTKHLLIMSQLL